MDSCQSRQPSLHWKECNTLIKKDLRQKNAFILVELFVVICRYFSTIVLFVFVALMSGCGDNKLKTYRVEGTIEYKGAPLAGTTITFYPVDSGATPAFGSTDDNGRYVLSTLAGNMGAGTTPGEYTVTITKREQVPTGTRIRTGGGENEFVEMMMKETLPAQYTTVQTTPFRVIVENKKMNTFDFKLE